MDLFMCLLSAVGGGLAAYIWFGGVRVGPFEETIMHGLRLGKKVAVSIGDDCYIFEMYGNRIRITRGTSTFEEEYYDELESTDMVSGVADKSGDNSQLGG